MKIECKISQFLKAHPGAWIQGRLGAGILDGICEYVYTRREVSMDYVTSCCPIGLVYAKYNYIKYNYIDAENLIERLADRISQTWDNPTFDRATCEDDSFVVSWNDEDGRTVNQVIELFESVGE